MRIRNRMIGLLSFIACQQKSPSKATIDKKEVSASKANDKKTSKVKKSTKAKKSKSVKDKLNLTDTQAKRVREIQADHQSKVDGLKKQNKWLGAEHAATRKKINEAKQNDLQAVLGNKYEKYRNLVSQPKKNSSDLKN